MKKTSTFRALFSTILCSILTHQTIFSQATNYCASTSAAPWELWISNVSFNTINNTSAKSKDLISFGYSDYTDISTTVTTGQTYTLSVTPGLSWSGYLPNANCRVWIDFNKNNIFEDAEQVLSDNNKNPFSQSISIPANATIGTTRMRVSMKWGALPTACETFFAKGEVEDYTVNIQAGVSNSCRTQDSLQLVSLYNATNGAHWTFNTWNLSTPINTWYGITLNADGCVIGISLSGHNLTGTIPNLNMPALQFLYLDHNNLSGSIPNFRDAFNASLLPKLGSLVLGNNQLSSSIPNFNLPLLYYLGLNDNNLSGSIPNFRDAFNASLLPILGTLVLSNNQLSGSIPNFNFPILENLYLDHNNLSGSIPVFNFPIILGFFLENNQLSGCIPVALKAFCNHSTKTSQFHGDISNNPNLATQDFAAFCSSNTGACTVPKINLTLTGFSVISGTVYGPNKLVQGANVNPIDGSLVGSNLPPTPISFKIRAYISKDQIIDANDYLLSQFTATVQPNFSQTDYLQEGGLNILAPNTKIPVDFPLGNYFLIVKIDADNEIAESNENDNIDITSIQILTNQVSPTDLLKLNISANPTTYRQYQVTTFTITATNNSSLPITNLKIKFPFPSKTATGGNSVASSGVFNEWCPGGVHCFEWNIPTIASGQQVSLTIPLYVQDATGNMTAAATLVSATPPQTTNIPLISTTLVVNPASSFLIGQNNTLALSSQVDYNKVNLLWLTNAQNVDYFEVQRANKNGDYIRIANQATKHGGPTNTQSYNFTDSNLNEGEYAYRIKATKIDGSEQFSDFQTVRIININDVVLFPNPSADELRIGLKHFANLEAKVYIYNNLGLIIKTLSVDGSDSIITTDISDLPTGSFYVRVVGKNKRDVVLRFVIAR